MATTIDDGRTLSQPLTAARSGDRDRVVRRLRLVISAFLILSPAGVVVAAPPHTSAAPQIVQSSAANDGYSRTSHSVDIAPQLKSIANVAQVGTLTIPGDPSAILVHAGRAKVYVADSMNGKVHVFNEDTRQLIKTIDGCAGIFQDNWVLDESLDKIYAGCGKHSTTGVLDGDGKLRVIDTVTDSIVNVLDLGAFGINYYKLVLDEIRHRIYVSLNAAFSPEVFVINGATDAATPIMEDGASAFGSININETTNRVYVVRTHRRDIVEIDGATLTVGGPFPFPYAQPSQAGVNQRENKLYAYSVFGPNGRPTVCIQDRDLAPPGCSFISGNDWGGIVTNERTNRVYLGVEVGDRIGILDGASDQLVEIPMDSATGASGSTNKSHNIVVDEDNDRAFFVNRDFLLIVSGHTSETRKIPYADKAPSGGGLLATAITMNKRTGSVFVIYDGTRVNKVAIFQDAVESNILTVAKAGTGSGLVLSNPAGINCGADCAETFPHDTAVTLTAASSVGSTFTGWSGACSGTVTSCTVTMTAARAVTATFEVDMRLLTVTKGGSGTGVVSSSPAGISCGADCSEAYAYATTVMLTAAPALGSTFTGWSGACGGTSTCAVTMTAARAVMATFGIDTPLLTVTKAGAGTGVVASSPAGINCGADCNETYAYGTVVTLTATPAAGSTFTGWSGACAATCMVTMTAAQAVTATFGIVPSEEGEADPDGDGMTNAQEDAAGTNRYIPNVQTLAEGATGFFLNRVALANPDPSVPADILVRYLRKTGPAIERTVEVPPLQRVTIAVNEEDVELGSTDVSTVVVAQRGGVVAERTMMWNRQDGSMYGGHTGKAVPAGRRKWYLAEGEASFFDTYILLANPGNTSAVASIRFLFDDGTTLTRDYTVDANARQTVWTNGIAGVRGRAFSATVDSSQPIIVERAMYFTTDERTWTGGTASAAIAEPSTTWFVAEGATGAFFDEYLLLANPNPTATTATIRFLRGDGQVITRELNLLPTSRTTLQVDTVPGLEWADVSAQITATQPILVERSMYWPQWPWKEGHNSAGATAIGRTWALAEGEQGGALQFATFILLANPGDVAATVNLTALRENRGPIVTTVTVPPHSRVTVPSSTFAGLGSAKLEDGERFGCLVESDQPIAVERAMYWNDGAGNVWSAGTNETATLIRP